MFKRKSKIQFIWVTFKLWIKFNNNSTSPTLTPTLTENTIYNFLKVNRSFKKIPEILGCLIWILSLERNDGGEGGGGQPRQGHRDHRCGHFNAWEGFEKYFKF